MSGSSGGHVPEISSGENVDCFNLSFITSLTGPVASAIAILNIGDELDVELISPSLQIFNANGVLVGSLLTLHRESIIKCINKGVHFIAIVIKINGGNCDIRIKAK